MIELPFAEASDVLGDIKERLKAMKPTPVNFYPYLKRVLNEQYEKLKPQYPKDIKIPKDTAHLLRQDFEPEYVIHLEDVPRMEDGTPMWFETSEDQCWLRFGYNNMDARFISDQKLSMEYIRATCSTISAVA